jgi:hypothetical protein
MDETIHELADLIAQFLVIALEDEARQRLQAEATELGATYEQFLAMSLTQLITNRFQLTTLAEPEESEPLEDDEADDDE